MNIYSIVTKYQSHLSNIQQFLICQHFGYFLQAFWKKGCDIKKPGGDTHRTARRSPPVTSPLMWEEAALRTFLLWGVIQSFTACDLSGAAVVDTGWRRQQPPRLLGWQLLQAAAARCSRIPLSSCSSLVPARLRKGTAHRRRPRRRPWRLQSTGRTQPRCSRGTEKWRRQLLQRWQRAARVGSLHWAGQKPGGRYNGRGLCGVKTHKGSILCRVGSHFQRWNHKSRRHKFLNSVIKSLQIHSFTTEPLPHVGTKS